MTVSPQYAASHFEELLDATDSGQDIEIARLNKPSVKLILVPNPEKFDRTGMVGSGKGMVWTSNDFDSPEAQTFAPELKNGQRILGAGVGELRIPSDEEWHAMDLEMERDMLDAPLTSAGHQ